MVALHRGQARHMAVLAFYSVLPNIDGNGPVARYFYLGEGDPHLLWFPKNDMSSTPSGRLIQH